jgi:hypothetical protein
MTIIYVRYGKKVNRFEEAMIKLVKTKRNFCFNITFIFFLKISEIVDQS